MILSQPFGKSRSQLVLIATYLISSYFTEWEKWNNELDNWKILNVVYTLNFMTEMNLARLRISLLLYKSKLIELR